MGQWVHEELKLMCFNSSCAHFPQFIEDCCAQFFLIGQAPDSQLRAHSTAVPQQNLAEAKVVTDVLRRILESGVGVTMMPTPTQGGRARYGPHEAPHDLF